MKRSALLLTLVALPLLATPSPARSRLRPTVSTFLGSGIAAYRSSACHCFDDRYIWAVEGGLGLQWHRYFTLEGEYRYGGIVMQGLYPTSGYAVGVRTALTPATERWWNDLYLRTGLSRLHVAGTRNGSTTGLYLHPGWAWELWQDRLYLDQEIAVDWFWGDVAHLDLGVRGGVRVVF